MSQLTVNYIIQMIIPGFSLAQAALFSLPTITSKMSTLFEDAANLANYKFQNLNNYPPKTFFFIPRAGISSGVFFTNGPKY
jgi:hypothetical protein